MTINADFDVKQLVLAGGAFGPREIDQLRESISRDMKKFDELKEAVNELKTKDEDELSPAVRVKLGVCMFLIGDYDGAYASLKKGDGGALTQFYFAKLHFVKREFDDAIRAYNTAQTAGYNSDECILGRAEVYREAGKLNESLQELDSLSGAVEQTAEYLYQRGATVNAIGGNPQEAIALYERAVSVDKDHPGALFGLALENERRGNDREALEYYQRAVRHFPTNVGTLINLGVLYEDMEMYELAQQCFQRVLDSYPNNPKARLFLKDVKASNEMHYDEEEQMRLRELGVKLNQPISDFELSVRARNCLSLMGVQTLRDLCKLTEQELLSSKNFGETSLEEIKRVLAEKNLRLGMYSAEKQRADANENAQLTPEEQSVLQRPVSDLNLSVRARKCMNRLGISTLGELVSRSADELLEIKNFGVTSLKEIRDKLGDFNIRLKGD